MNPCQPASRPSRNSTRTTRRGPGSRRTSLDDEFARCRSALEDALKVVRSVSNRQLPNVTNSRPACSIASAVFGRRMHSSARETARACGAFTERVGRVCSSMHNLVRNRYCSDRQGVGPHLSVPLGDCWARDPALSLFPNAGPSAQYRFGSSTGEETFRVDSSRHWLRHLSNLTPVPEPNR